MNPIGIYFAYWTQDWDVEFTPFVKKAHDLGFDMLGISTAGIVDAPRQTITELRKYAEDLNIQLAFCLGLEKKYDLASFDKSVRDEGIEYIKRTLEAIHTAGGKTFEGIQYGCWGIYEGHLADKRPMLENSIDSVKKVIKTAENYGINYCLEVVNRFEQYLINTAKEAVAYVKEVDSPNIKIMLDTFHMNIEEDSFREAILTAGKYLGFFHTGEANRKPPGMGRLPWDEICTALKEIEYDGPIVMEPFLKMGGQVGYDIRVWREIIPGVTDEQMDKYVKDSCVFLRNKMQK